MGNKQPKQPSWSSIAWHSISGTWFYLLVVVGIVGSIALLNYIRYQGVLVPLLVAFGGSAVLLLFGYWLWRPLVRVGYILMSVGVWFFVTSLVLRLFAFGPLIGVLGSGLWLLASALGIPLFVLGWIEETKQQEAARAREEERGRKAAASPLPDERRVYSPQNCVTCGADLTQRRVTNRVSRRVDEQADDAPAGRKRLVEHVVEQRQCACGQRTVAAFPDGSRPGYI